MHAPVSDIRLNALSAEKLKISEDQRDALVWFVEQVDLGVIQPIPYSFRDIDLSVRSFTNRYNQAERPDYFLMRAVNAVVTSGEGDCKTAGCVLGWCKWYKPHAFPDYDMGSSEPLRDKVPSPLQSLFFERISDSLADVTQRVRNFLTTGSQYRA